VNGAGGLCRVDQLLDSEHAANHEIAIIEDGRNAAEGVLDAAAVREFPTLLDLAGVPVDADVFVFVVGFVGVVHEARCGGHNRHHDVRVVDLIVRPGVLELVRFSAPGEFLYLKRRLKRHTRGEHIRCTVNTGDRFRQDDLLCKETD
jgi:hypothetical protein